MCCGLDIAIIVFGSETVSAHGRQLAFRSSVRVETAIHA
jgi:hypothetical protein